jgi:predicted nucleotide-binding protein
MLLGPTFLRAATRSSVKRRTALLLAVGRRREGIAAAYIIGRSNFSLRLPLPTSLLHDLQIIKDNGQFVGFIRDTKTGPFVAVDDPQPRPVRMDADADADSAGQEPDETKDIIPAAPPKLPAATKPAAPDGFKVFISHSKNTAMVDQVKDVLDLYDIDYEVAVEEETAAIPVPTKVMASMRRCQAGIVMVTADEQNKNGDGYTINTNVLIEIGAAFVLYDQGVILVWDRRLKVPSNLQGLYRIDFEGAELSFATGTRLAKPVKGLRKGPVTGVVVSSLPTTRTFSTNLGTSCGEYGRLP